MCGTGEMIWRSGIETMLRKLLKRFEPNPHMLCRYASSVRFLETATVKNILGDPDRIFIDEYTVIRGELLTFAHGGNIRIGKYCYLGEQSRIWSARSIVIGDRVLISHNVNIFDNDTHPIDDPDARHRQFKAIITTGHPRHLDLNESAVVIEDDVLIGCQCVVLKGVTIGKGSVVGAGSIVTKDVPPFTLVAGNPAQVIRQIGVSSELRL